MADLRVVDFKQNQIAEERNKITIKILEEVLEEVKAGKIGPLTVLYENEMDTDPGTHAWVWRTNIHPYDVNMHLQITTMEQFKYWALFGHGEDEDFYFDEE